MAWFFGVALALLSKLAFGAHPASIGGDAAAAASSSCPTSSTWNSSWGDVFDGQGCIRGKMEVPGTGKTVRNTTFQGHGHERDKYTYQYITGAGLGLDGGNGTVEDCSFLSNYHMHGGAGGGIRALGDDAPSTVQSCYFFNNGALHGGGGICYESGGTALHCSFIRNCKDGGAGALRGVKAKGGGGQASVFIQDCFFLENAQRAINGNKIKAVQDCTFHSNSGGGVQLERFSGNLEATNCTFVNNTSPNGGGGAIELGASQNYPSDVEVQSCFFLGNNAAAHGGGINLRKTDHHAARLSVRFCFFPNNSNSGEGRGGGICFSGTRSDRPRGDTLTVQSCSFLFNNAEGDGGGMFCNPSRDKFTTIQSCVFLGNTASGNGGAVHTLNSKDNVVNSTFQSNAAEDNGGALSASGDKYASRLLHVQRCSFVRNEAGLRGGAISAELDRQLAQQQLDECYFHGNTAPVGADVAWVEATYLLCSKSSGSESITEAAIVAGNGALQIGRSCPAGHTWVLSGDGDPECAEGEYARPATNHSNSTLRVCAPCDPGHVCNGVNRTACAAGRYQPARSATGQCYACEPGFYGPEEASASCTKCPAGRHQYQNASLACSACPVGRFQAFLGTTTCDQCENGQRYQDQAGKSSCKKCDSCAAGASVNSGTAACSSSKGGIARAQNTSTLLPDFCTYCEPGRYGDVANLFGGACKACPAGHVSNSTGTLACDICPAGQYSAQDGMFLCKNCPARHKQAAPGKATCAACQPGAFSVPGSTECESCPEGWRSTGSGCVACETGKYNPTINQLWCLNCAAGQYQDEAAIESCVLCALGTAQADTGKSSCTACASGLVASTVGKSSCEACETDNEYVPVARGAIKCRECAENAVAVAGRLTCECKPGYFEPMLGLDALQRPNATRKPCRLCPLGATCNPALGGNETVQFEGRLATRKGYWRARDWRRMRASKPGEQASDRERFLRCPVAEACEGTANILAGLSIRNTTNTTGLQAGQCRHGHTGIVCQACVPGYRPSAAELCVECSGTASGPSPSTVKILVFVVFTIALVAIITTILTSRRLNDVDKQASAASESTSTMSDVKDMVSRLGTAALTLQRIVALDDVFSSLPWPPVMTRVLSVLKVFVMQIGKLMAFISPCNLHVNVEQQFWMALLCVPWAAGVGVATLFATKRVFAWRRWQLNRGHRRAVRKQQRSRKKKKHGRGSAEEKQEDVASAPHTHGSRQEESTAAARLIAIGMLAAKLGHAGISAQLLVVGVCDDVVGVLEADVQVECSMSDPVYVRVLAVSVAGLVLVTLGLPLLLASTVQRDHVRFQRSRALHAASVAKERQNEVRDLLHVKTVQEQVAAKVHRWHERRTERLEVQRHKSINWIVAKYRDSLWWWFLVEMLLSLVLISLLQLFSGELWHQYYAGILAAGVQVVLPAIYRPHHEAGEDWVSIVGGAVYFVLLVGRLPRHFVDLRMNTPEFDATEHDAAVRETDLLVDTTFVLGTVAILVAVGGDLLNWVWHALCRPCAWCSSRRISPRKVVPVDKPQRKGTAVSGSHLTSPKPSSEGFPSASGGRGDTPPPPASHLHRCANSLLASVRAPLRQEYTAAWALVEKLQAEVMATAIQAAARGFRGRNGSLPHLLAELGRASKDRTSSAGTPMIPGKVVSISTQRAKVHHRSLRHSQAKTSVLLEAASAYVDGSGGSGRGECSDGGQRSNGVAKGEDKAKAAALLAAAETFTAAEISGLHEASRLSDAQVVAIKQLQYQKEIKEADAALASEAEDQKVKGHRRNLQRGFKHHFRTSELSGKDLASVFAAVDKDGSGTIDVMELVAMFKDVFDRDLSKTDAQELMRAADLDGDDSTMSVAELRKVLLPPPRSSTLSAEGLRKVLQPARASTMSAAGLRTVLMPDDGKNTE